MEEVILDIDCKSRRSIQGNLLSRTISLGTFYRVGDSFVTILALEWR